MTAAEIIYGYRHEDQDQNRRAYDAGDLGSTRGASSESNLEFIHRVQAAANGSNRRSARTETTEYVRWVWGHIIPNLAGTDMHRTELIARAVAIGTTNERAQMAYDIRHALAIHGPAGLPAYLQHMATRLLDLPGQENRAGMLACLANAIDPASMSTEFREMQRKHWGLSPADAKTDRGRTRRSRR